MCELLLERLLVSSVLAVSIYDSAPLATMGSKKVGCGHKISSGEITLTAGGYRIAHAH